MYIIKGRSVTRLVVQVSVTPFIQHGTHLHVQALKRYIYISTSKFKLISFWFTFFSSYTKDNDLLVTENRKNVVYTFAFIYFYFFYSEKHQRAKNTKKKRKHMLT